MNYQQKIVNSDVWCKENLSLNETPSKIQNLAEKIKFDKKDKELNKQIEILKEKNNFNKKQVKTQMENLFQQIKIKPTSRATNKNPKLNKRSRKENVIQKNKPRSRAKAQGAHLKYRSQPKSQQPQAMIDDWVELLMRVYNLNFTNDFQDLNYFKQVLKQRDRSLITILQTPILEKQKLFQSKTTPIERVLGCYTRVIAQLEKELTFLKKLAVSEVYQNDISSSEKSCQSGASREEKKRSTHDLPVSQKNLLVHRNEIVPSIILSTDFDSKQIISNVL